MINVSFTISNIYLCYPSTTSLYPIPYTIYRIPNALLQWGQYITDIRLYNTYINTNTTPKLRFHYSLLAHTSNYDIDIDINKSTATTLC